MDTSAETKWTLHDQRGDAVDHRFSFFAGDEIAALLDVTRFDGRDRQFAEELLRRWNAHDDLVKALTGASHALRSYQYGNASSELAESMVGVCDAALALARGEQP